jgi:hypothetical protein
MTKPIGSPWKKLKTLPSPYASEQCTNIDVLVTSLCWGTSRRELVAAYEAHGVV